MPRCKNLITERQHARDARVKLKIALYTHYGGGRPTCVRCGFADIRALSLDHINGRGPNEPKGINYSALRRNNYPPGYQTLCMNCQMIKRAERGEVWNYRAPKVILRSGHPCPPGCTCGRHSNHRPRRKYLEV